MRSGTGKATAVVTAMGLSMVAWQTAGAADLPRAAPVVKAPVVVAGPNWTGFYVNAGGGYGIWNADTTTVATPGSPAAPMVLESRQGGSGWLGRVGIGFDYHLWPRIVVGVFGDYDFSDIEGSLVDPAPLITGRIKQTSSWAAGARAGLLATPNILTYWNGGYTSARFSSATMVNSGAGPLGAAGVATGHTTPEFTANGWFLGGGTDMALTSFGPGWYWRNEYRYAYYERQALTDTRGSGFPTVLNTINFKPTVQTVTTQLVYKLNPGLGGASYDMGAAPAIPAYWSGLYVGGGIGYGAWAADTSATTSPVNQTQGGNGWLGRVTVGYDWQAGSMLVLGVFADGDGSSLKGTLQDSGGTIAGDIKQNWSWAAGGRLGLAVTPGILSFVNGGYASAHFSSTNLVPVLASGGPTGFGTADFDTSGWFVGGGVEFGVSLLGPSWFWRNDYRFAQYQSKTLPESNAAGFTPSSITFKPQVQTITTSLIYKFNWNSF